MKKVYTRKSFEKEIGTLATKIADTAALVREGYVDILTLQKLQSRYIEMYQYYLSTICVSNKKIFAY